jgi:hypothetical protein
VEVREREEKRRGDIVVTGRKGGEWRDLGERVVIVREGDDRVVNGNERGICGEWNRRKAKWGEGRQSKGRDREWRRRAEYVGNGIEGGKSVVKGREGEIAWGMKGKETRA